MGRNAGRTIPGLLSALFTTERDGYNAVAKSARCESDPRSGERSYGTRAWESAKLHISVA